MGQPTLRHHDTIKSCMFHCMWWVCTYCNHMSTNICMFGEQILHCDDCWNPLSGSRILCAAGRVFRVHCSDLSFSLPHNYIHLHFWLLFLAGMGWCWIADGH